MTRKFHISIVFVVLMLLRLVPAFSSDPVMMVGQGAMSTQEALPATIE